VVHGGIPIGEFNNKRILDVAAFQLIVYRHENLFGAACRPKNPSYGRRSPSSFATVAKAREATT
jgi:hypothetical protein